MKTRKYSDGGAFFHIYNRGARKDLIFFDDEDRRLWLQVVISALVRGGSTIHAMCLMGNHVHMLVQGRAVPSWALRDALSVYVRRFNRRHGFDGPLHRSRFGRKQIRSDDQFLTTSRYIHRNPLDAFDGPLDRYRWSTYRWLIDPTSAPGWLDTDFTLALMDGDPARYRRFVEGSDALQGAAHLDRGLTPDHPLLLADVLDAVAAVTQVRWTDLRAGRPGVRNPARLAVCLLASERAIAPSTVADELGYGSGDSVRALARRAAGLLERDPSFERLVDRARAILSFEADRRAA